MSTPAISPTEIATPPTQPAPCPAAAGASGPGIVVVDTDIAYDPDDIVTLALAARLVPESDHLIVITADETKGRRARIAKRLLELMDRPNVAVLPGIDLGGHHRFVMDDQLPGTNRVPPFDFVDTINTASVIYPGPVLWVGCGPMTNLKEVLLDLPELSERIQLVQMGGWLDPLWRGFGADR